MLPTESSITPGISLLPRTRGPMPERNSRFPTRFAGGNAPTGSGARLLSKDLLIVVSLMVRSGRLRGFVSSTTCKSRVDHKCREWNDHGRAEYPDVGARPRP